jgi:PAS domain S-box-containing protein
MDRLGDLMPSWSTRWGASLATLVAAAILPIALSGAVAIGVLIDRQHTLMEAELRASADGLLTAVDMELEHQLATLRGLAVSPSLAEGRLEAFHAIAQRVLAAHPEWLTVVLLDSTGQRQLLNTLRPFGVDLPPPTQAWQDNVRDGRPGLGPVKTRGRLIDEPFVPIRAPVTIDGAVRYVLAGALRPSRLTDIVDRIGAGLPLRRVQIFDHEFNVAAQWPNNLDVGRQANDSLMAAAHAHGEGLVEAVAADGVRTVTALRRSGRSGWWVGVSTPQSALLAPLHRTVGIVAAAGIVAALLSVWLSMVLGQRIRRRAQLDERRSAARLHEVQQRLLRLANIAPCFVWSCGADGLPTWVSDRWLEFTGLQADEATGPGSYGLVHPDDEGAVLTRFGETTRETLDFELRLRDRAGDYSWFRTKAQAVRDDQGRFVEWIGVTIDINSAKMVEDALAEYARLQRLAKEEAERANRAKSRFLAAASHDLRQPFQAMHLYHAVLATREVDERTRQAIGGLRLAMEAGEELLQALLDVSSFEAGTVRPTIAEFCAGEVVRELAAECTTLAQRQGMVLRARGADLSVASDRVLLKRMLRNLVSNALRYTRSGGILISCRRRGAKVLFQVWDTGIGIADTEIQLIFEDFYQVDNPARDRSRGLGLGLSIVQRTAALLGHEISVASRPGRGSVFTIAVAAATAMPVPGAVATA